MLVENTALTHVKLYEFVGTFSSILQKYLNGKNDDVFGNLIGLT
jgi:hypothetical protein